MSENKQSLQKPTSVYLFLGYFLWPFSLIGLAIEKEDDFIRFHCAQAFTYTVVQVILGVLMSFFSPWVWLIFPILFMAVIGVAMCGYLVLAIITLVKAAQGEKYKMLVLGDFSEKYVQKWFLK